MLYSNSGYQANSFLSFGNSPSRTPTPMGQFGYNPWLKTAYLPVVGEEETCQGPTSPGAYDEGGENHPGSPLSSGEVSSSQLETLLNHTTDNNIFASRQSPHLSGPSYGNQSPSGDHSSERPMCNGDIQHNDFHHGGDVGQAHTSNGVPSHRVGMSFEGGKSPHNVDYTHPFSVHQYSPSQSSVMPTSPRHSPVSMVTVVSSSAGKIPSLLSVQQPVSVGEGTNGIDPGLNQLIQTSLRFAVSITMPTNKQINDILSEIHKALDARSRSIIYQQESELKFELRKSSVKLEMEVCAGTQQNDLKIRKLAGDNLEYTNLCKDLLAGMNL